jgi:glycosyltransferase involved in cell wall biosynthesis
VISIIIPAYNSDKTLIKTLESIYKNNFNDFEVIVIDDGSADNNKEWARNYPLTYIRLEINKGAAFARNLGVSLAREDILLFLDADIEIKEHLLYYIDEQFKGFDYDALSGVFSEEPKIKNIFLQFQSSLSHYNFSRTDFTFSTHLGAVKKKVFKELGGFNERFKGAAVEDFDFSQRLIIGGYRCKTDMNMAAYHNNNFTFFSFYRRMFRFGLLKTPIILKYNSNLLVRKQRQRYLVNNEYIFSYILIILLIPAAILTIYPKFNIFILLFWLASYILVKRSYLLSLKDKHFLMFVLLIFNDIVVLTGCLMGACRYYYDRYFKKSYI